MQKPSILHISQSDIAGGAAIAARRLVVAQREAGLDANMLVVQRYSDKKFHQCEGGLVTALRARVARMAAQRIGRIGAKVDPTGMRSLSMVPTGLGKAIRRCDPDIVHWHWVGKEVVSLREMASVGKPAVWTCHDQWAFCGAEHYAPDRRFVSGYIGAACTDIDALTFRRKQSAWANWHPTLICPSEWMACEARASALMGEENIVAIPNTLDTSEFMPQPRDLSMAQFQLPQDRQVVLFGADTGLVDPRKGFDLLMGALEKIPSKRKAAMLLVTFGGAARKTGSLVGFDHMELGRLSSQKRLATLYSAADVFVAPSRQDNLPNTVVEAQACGLPCVAFDIGGMGDIITRPMHGALIPPFEIDGLAEAIQRVASSSRDRAKIHQDAVARFGAESVVSKHQSLYLKLIDAGKSA